MEPEEEFDSEILEEFVLKFKKGKFFLLQKLLFFVLLEKMNGHFCLE